MMRACRLACVNTLVTACIGLSVSGCALGAHEAGRPPLVVTEPAVPVTIVAVVSTARAGQSFARLAAATVRPEEAIDVVWPGPRPMILTAAASPLPARVSVPAKPVAPGPGSNSYQWAKYHGAMTGWLGKRTAAIRSVRVSTNAADAAWVSRLAIAAKVAKYANAARDQPGTRHAGSLGVECSVAARDLASLASGAAGAGGAGRVVLLYARSLNGTLPPGELTGDDVIVVTTFLPTAAQLSAAQARLLGAGAATASIVGPATTRAQLDELVTLGLTGHAGGETVSRALPFANDSARLSPPVMRALTTMLAPLRQQGATAVIIGYASTPGTRKANYLLSYARADAVALFFETHGIPARALDIVGHGASGSSAANRRVLVLIDGATRSG